MNAMIVLKLLLSHYGWSSVNLGALVILWDFFFLNTCCVFLFGQPVLLKYDSLVIFAGLLANLILTFSFFNT